MIYLSKYIVDNLIESIKYKYFLTITYVIKINKDKYEIKKLKKLKHFTVTAIVLPYYCYRIVIVFPHDIRGLFKCLINRNNHSL